MAAMTYRILLWDVHGDLTICLKNYDPPLASLFKHQEERLPISDELRVHPRKQEYEEQEVIEDTVPRVIIAVIFLYPFP